jgi:hypothetical protein
MRATGQSSRAPGLEYARFVSVPCLASALLMLLGAIGPWVRVGPFALSGFDGVGLPLALLAGLAVGVSALQLSAQRRSLFVVLAVLGVLALGGCALAWTVLKVFSGSAHLLSFALAGGQHEAAFQSHAPTAAWGLWLLPLSAASLVAAACAGAAMGTTPKPMAPSRSTEPRHADVFPPASAPSGGGADHVPTRWR